MREGNEAVELWLEIDEEERERESAGRGTEKLNRRDRGISSQQRRRSPHLPPVKDGPSTMVSENRQDTGKPQAKGGGFNEEGEGLPGRKCVGAEEKASRD